MGASGKVGQKSGSEDTALGDASVPGSAKATPAKSGRVIDEIYDDTSSSDAGSSKNGHGTRSLKLNADDSSSQQSTSAADSGRSDSMDLRDRTPTATSPYSTHPPKPNSNATPLLLLPLYSLHTSNAFATQIPIGASDPYSPHDHWQWTATQWRGIIGPDLTIYVRDGVAGEAAGVEVGRVEGRGDVGVIVVRRSSGGDGGERYGDSGMGIEGSVLRRLGFEVGEWVRGFNLLGSKE